MEFDSLISSCVIWVNWDFKVLSFVINIGFFCIVLIFCVCLFLVEFVFLVVLLLLYFWGRDIFIFLVYFGGLNGDERL